MKQEVVQSAIDWRGLVGYKLSSLVHMPLDENVEMYVFCIGDTLWEGGLGEAVRRNFDQLAREIGPAAIIVGALEEEFHGEVVEQYLGRNHRELKNRMPALLITDSHPEELSETSLRVLVSLRDAHQHYLVIDDFLADLARFVRGESDELLRVLEAAPSSQEVLGDIVEVSIQLGIVAVNLSSAVKHLRNWWDRRKRESNGQEPLKGFG